MSAKELAAELRVAWRAVPGVVRDRERLVGWLKGARAAWIALAIAIVVGLTIMPAIRDAVVDTIAPARTTGGFFRRRREESPAAGVLRFTISGLYWIAALGGVGALLVLRVPRKEEREPIDASAATLLPTSSPLPSSTAATAIAPPTNKIGGRYVIESELGRGGMGLVHRARDTVLDRAVALKELPPALRSDPALAERFRTEARVLAKLAHPGIVQIYDLVEDERGMWMAMEIVPGGSLDARLEGGPLPVADAIELARRMAEAMAYAHAQGVVHRDFKPHNVLLAADGSPKVTDFGLAKLVQSQGPALTQAGTVLGSPAYMSPEQASGREADARSDVYALGATLYELLTGRPPFVGETASVLLQHITQPPPRPSELAPAPLPEAVEALLLRMLAKEPADRPADMDAVARELDAIARAASAS